MDGVAVGVHGRMAGRAATIYKIARFLRRTSAAFDGFRESVVRVLNMKSDVAHRVAVLLEVLADLAFRVERRGQQQAGFTLFERIPAAVALPGLYSGISALGKAERMAVEGHGLSGVSDSQFDVVNLFELYWICDHRRALLIR